MVKTLGFGRLTRGGPGLKTVVGTLAADSTKGSFSVPINTPLFVSMMVSGTGSGPLAGSAIIPKPYGTSKTGYIPYRLMRVGTFGRPASKGTYPVSYRVIGY